MNNIINNISDYICRTNTTIIDVVRRINAVDGLFQCVVDSKDRFVGTVTDGDVRRGLLRNVSLTDTIETCVFRQAKTGRLGVTEDELERILTTIPLGRPFVPILDDEGHINHIVIRSSLEFDNFAALVMAGGRGTRLGACTSNTPKPLISVGGEPMLERVLKRLESACVQQTFISVHYLAEQIQSFVANRSSTHPIQLLYEEQPLGTAGAIYQVPHHIDLPLLVMNADVLTDLDIRSLLHFHKLQSYDITIAVAIHEVTIPYGVIDHDEQGVFRAIREKPIVSNFIASGVYVLEPSVRNLVPANRRMDMPELLENAFTLGFRIGLYALHEYWTDIGRPEDLEIAHNFITGPV